MFNSSSSSSSPCPCDRKYLASKYGQLNFCISVFLTTFWFCFWFPEKFEITWAPEVIEERYQEAQSWGTKQLLDFYLDVDIAQACGPNS